MGQYNRLWQIFLKCQKSAVVLLQQKGTITQVTNDLVKLKNNGQLTAKDIRKLIIPIIKSCTESNNVSRLCKPGCRLHKEDKHCYVIT